MSLDSGLALFSCTVLIRGYTSWFVLWFLIDGDVSLLVPSTVRPKPAQQGDHFDLTKDYHGRQIPGQDRFPRACG
jgi:hypothetical protein